MPSLFEVESTLQLAERRLDRTIGEAKALGAQIKRHQEEADRARETMVTTEQAVAFLNSFADEQQVFVQQRIESLVTHGLQTIFGDLTFHIVSEQKANRTEVSFVLRSLMNDKIVETSILDARGGGVAAVIGFLLRLVITLLRGERPLLCLDETFAQVSEEYLPRVGEFMKELVDQTGVQILMVTHSEVFTDYADVVYRFGQKSGQTTLTRTDT